MLGLQQFFLYKFYRHHYQSLKKKKKCNLNIHLVIVTSITFIIVLVFTSLNPYQKYPRQDF